MDTHSKKLLLAIVAFACLAIFQTFWGEKISVNGGLGWDGQRYAVIIRDMDYMLKHEQMDNYHLKRISTLWIINNSLKVLQIPVSHSSIVWAFAMFNLFCYLSSLILSYFIARKTNPNAFILVVMLFGNIYLSKLFFFYPVLTDSLAFLLSTMMIWFWYQNHKILLFLISFIAFFVYPILPFIGFVLCLFPFSAHFNMGNNFSKPLYSIAILTAVGSVAVISCYLSYIYLPSNTSQLLSSSSFIQENLNLRAFNLFTLLLLPAAFIILFIVFIARKISIDYRNFLKIDDLVGTAFYLFICSLIYILVENISPRIAPTISKYSANSYLQSLLLNSSHLPFKNWVSHIQFYGFIVFIPILILVQFYRNLMQLNIGLFIVLLLFIIQSIDCESRHLFIYLPFILFASLFYLPNFKFNIGSLGLLVIIFFSKFWIQIGQLTETRLVPFGEWQRFFKYHGPWMSEEAYLAAIPSTLVMIGLFVWYARKINTNTMD